MNRKPSSVRVGLLLFSAALSLSLTTGMPGPAHVLASGTVLYAKHGGLATGACDGWTNACTLPYALSSAQTGDEVWTMAGIYTPTVPAGRDATFQLVTGVAVYGGFAGTETNRDQRDWNAHVTVLSGDLDGNDITTPSGVITATANIKGANAYTVVTASGVTTTTVLDGFTITGGDASDSGGGMYNFNGSPTVQNVTFSGNRAANDGGGLYIYNSSPSLANVTFYGNSAFCGGGMEIQGDFLNGQPNSNPTLIDVAFLKNAAGNNNPVGNNCGGGGLYLDEFCSATLTNVIFWANTAGGGGGMYVDQPLANLALTNCSFSRNSVVHDGGGLYVGDDSNTTLTNCILWGDTGQEGEIGFDPTTFTTDPAAVTYSDVQGGHIGTGNKNANPLFLNAAAGNLRLAPGSPAIDAGNSLAPGLTGISTDLDGLSRILGASVDMGAYEFDAASWKSFFLPLVKR